MGLLNDQLNEDLIAFLESLLRSRERIALTAIDPSKQKSILGGQFTSAQAAAEWSEKTNADGYNIYFTINPAREFGGSKAASDDITAFFAFKIDIDPKRAGSQNMMANESERDAVEARILAPLVQFIELNLGITPMIISSGSGFQVLIQFDPMPTPTKTFQRAMEAFLKFLSAKFTIDEIGDVDTSVSDMPRIFALPGTLKMKSVNTEVRPWRIVYLVDKGTPVALDKFTVFVDRILEMWEDRKIARWVERLPRFENFHNEKLSYVAYLKKYGKLDEATVLKVVNLYTWLRGDTNWNMDSEEADNERMVGDTFRKDDEAISIKHILDTDTLKILDRTFSTSGAPDNIHRIVDQREGRQPAPIRAKPAPTPSGEGPELPTLTNEEIDSLLTGTDARYTDSGNAYYFVDFLSRTKKHVRFSIETNRWYYWDEKRWREDVSGTFIQGQMEDAMNYYVIELAHQITAGVVSDKKAMPHALNSLNKAKIEAAVSQSRHKLAINYFRFNSDNYKVNVLNGTINLRTADRKPHDPEDYITNLIPINYDPKAECPRFRKFLAEILPGVPEEYLQMWFGLGLTGEDRERIFQIWQGASGANGKTTLKNIMLHILAEYATEVPIETFIGKNRDYKHDDLVPLRQKRMVFTSEPEEGAILNASLLKRVAGRDTIRCRPLHSNTWVEYRPTFKIMILTNHEMRIYESGEPIWTRLHLIDYPNSFRDQRDDKDLDEKLRAESEGILAWMIGGIRLWLNEKKLPKPEKIVGDTSEYRKRQDTFGQFLKAYSEGMSGIGARWPVGAKALKNAYKTWMDDESMGKAVAGTRFDSLMEERGYRKIRRNQGLVWLKADEKDEKSVEVYTSVPKTSKLSLESSRVESLPENATPVYTSTLFPSQNEQKPTQNNQMLLEEAEPALKPVVEATIAVQAKIAKAKDEEGKYALPVKDATVYKIAAFDLETVGLDVTDPNNRILSIGFAGSDGFVESWAYDDERETIKAFVEKAQDYTCLLGWNTDKFDLPVLRARVEGWDDTAIPPVLDALRAHKLLLRKGETNFQLDYVAKKHLGKGKIEFDPARTKQYFDDPIGREKLREYNMRDAQLVLELNAVMGYFDTFEAIVERASFETVHDGDPMWMQTPDSLRRQFAQASKNKIDNGFSWWRPVMGTIEKYCRANGVKNTYEWPTDSEKEERKELIKQERPGGFVMNPVKGHHTNVIEFDFKSLYPSLMISFDMGPDTWMPPGNGDIKAPFGTYYSRVKSIMAGTLEGLVAERESVKRELNAAKARGASTEERAALKGRTEALKILVNGFYGQCYAPFSPLFHFDTARNITTLGQECVRLMLDTVKDHGARAIAGDTDSTYIEVPLEKFNEAFAEELSKILTERIAVHLKEKYGVKFVGSFDLKGLYDHLAIFKKKRYSKLEKGKTVEDMDTIGYQRGDTFELQLDLQEEIFRRMFNPSRGTIPGAISDARERLRTDHLLVLRWRRGKTSAEGRALSFLVANNLPPIPGDSVGFLILGKGTKKDPQHRIAARRLDSENIEWVDERDGVLLRGPSRDRIFLIAAEEDVVWASILERLDGLSRPEKSDQVKFEIDAAHMEKEEP